MEEFSDIYVDIGNVRVSYGLVDPRNIIECNEYTKAGTRTNPLNIYQFRDYLYYDHGKSQTFHIKGSAILDIELSSDVGMLGVDTLFETPHTKRNIVIKNWEDDSQDTQEPWAIIVSGASLSASNGNVKIVSNNDILEILNGEIELVDENKIISFGTNDDNFLYEDIDDEFNRIGLINTKIYTSASMDIDNGIHSFSFNNYHHVDVVNSLLNNKDSGGSVLINNTYTSGNNVNFVNSIFNRIDYFYGFPANKLKEDDSITSVVRNCAFSSLLSGFVRGGDTSNVFNLFQISDFNIENNVQLGWAGSSACDETFVNMSQSADFNYLNDGWIDISLSGLTDTREGTTLNNYSVRPYQFTKYRDGIGPLSFPTMGEAFITITSAENDYTISAYNTSGYDDLYKPSYYEWTFEENSYSVENEETLNVSATSAFDIVHEYDTYGDRIVSVIIHSHNGWYTVIGKEPAFIVFVPSFNMIANRTVNDCYGDYLTSAVNANGVLSAYAFDLIDLQVINTSNRGGQTFKSWGVDFCQYPVTDSFYNIFWKQKTYPDGGLFSMSGYSDYSNFRYIKPGYYHINFGAQSVNSEVYVSAVPIIIYEKPIDEYYVDLDEEYDYSDKWIYKRTGIYDTFESGGLDTGWGTAFKSAFSVTDMWGDKCATGGEANVIDTSASYAFDYEWSFVRTSRDPIPSMSLVSGDGTTNILNVMWDYNNDRINFMLDPFGNNPIVYPVKYNLKKWGLLKNLECANSLRTVSIRVQTNVGPFTNIMRVFIKFFDTWEEYSFIFGDGNNFPSENHFVRASAPTGTGFGYMKLQSRCGFPYLNGSEDYPLTWQEFLYMTDTSEYDNNTIRDYLPTADYKSKFYFKGYRHVDEKYIMINERLYEIEAWNFSSNGPWMIIWNVFLSFFPETGEDYLTNRISFQGATLKNGIMYNIREGQPGAYIIPNIELSYLYNMFVVWNSPDDGSDRETGYIHLCNRQTPDSKIYNIYSKYYGTTLISEKGLTSFKIDN